MTETPLYVARFLAHPLGAGRFVKDFYRNLTCLGKTWWDAADEETRQHHFVWALNHKQYHYSTDDIQNADLFHMDDGDAEDREILAKYAEVEYLPVSIEIE